MLKFFRNSKIKSSKFAVTWDENAKIVIRQNWIDLSQTKTKIQLHIL